LTASADASLVGKHRSTPGSVRAHGTAVDPAHGTEPDLLKKRDYTAVFEASPDAMLVVDPDGVIRDLNRQALAL